MDSLLKFLGETLFGVGCIAFCVLLGIMWYLKRLNTELRKVREFMERR